jgi:hypothetical protein
MKARWPSQAIFFPGRMKPKDVPSQHDARLHKAVTASDNLLTGRPLTPRRRAALLLKRQRGRDA